MSERKSDSPAETTLVLTRVFSARRPLVFTAWTEKKYLDQWSCPNGFTVPESEGDLRPGGKFRMVMIDPGGGKHIVCGTYREIVPNERLVMTHGWADGAGKAEHETILTVIFADEGTGETRLTMEQKHFASIEERNGHRDGWSQCLDKLAKLLEESVSGKS